MASKLPLPSSLFLVICSWVFVGLSHGKIDFDKSLIGAFIAGGSNGVSAMPCVSKLMPCQSDLASHSTKPPPTCCVPLKDMVTKDAECLCSVLGNPDLMKSFNVTIDEAVSFAKACGAIPDLSLCKNAAATPGTTPSLPSAPASNGSSSSNKTAEAPASNGASVTSKFGGFVAIVSLMSLVMSTF